MLSSPYSVCHECARVYSVQKLDAKLYPLPVVKSEENCQSQFANIQNDVGALQLQLLPHISHSHNSQS